MAKIIFYIKYFLFLFILFFEYSCNNPVNSNNSFSTLRGGIGDGAVWGLTVYNNQLIAGGNFTIAGGASANHLALWNGSSWSQIGSGVSGGESNSGVIALTVYNGNLIAGGFFTMAGSDSANNIAQWNGDSWSALGKGVFVVAHSSWINTLVIYNGNLIAGGFFTMAGSDSANNIAQWNGNSWSPLNSGLSGGASVVLALIVYNGNLVAGGSFTQAGSINVNNIAQWNGSLWSSLASGVLGSSSEIQALTVYSGNLIAGGSFTQAGGNSANNIAQWNGSTWLPLGSGVSGGSPSTWINILMVYENNLIAGGNFSQAGGNNINYLAKWNGSSWLPLISSLSFNTNTGIYALTIYNGNLIVGGYFSTSGVISANNIFQWH